MRLFLKIAVCVLSAVPVAAQNHPMPTAVPDPPVLCTGCPGTNSAGEPNAGKPTFPYDSPVALHIGRYVDSSTTSTVQNFGMRTLRAGSIRVAPAARNRIYLGLGATVGAYALDTFFSGKLLQPMVAVNTIPTGSVYGGRNPFEKLAKPDRFFYAEANTSGWTTPLVDGSTVLNDFDSDDRGLLYIGTQNFGWGIASDPGDATGTQLPFVAQVTTDSQVASLLTLRSGEFYYSYTSSGTSTARLYDVTASATPQLLGTRSGTSAAFAAWSRYEAGQWVALLCLDGHVRVYTYAALIGNTAPVADVTPTAGRFFADLSFDDGGELWLAESTNASTTNLLYRLTASGGGYTTTTYDLYGTPFMPRKIHASAGYIAVAGFGAAGSSDFDLRLLKMIGGVPQLQATNGFFGKYYHRAPLGYAQPVLSGTPNVRVLAQSGKTYLFYGAFGLGDVYQLSDEARITSMTPLSGIPAGGTTVTIYGTGFTAGATVTFGGVAAATSSFISPTQMTAQSPIHASGSVDVVVSVPAAVPMTAPRQFTYILAAPQSLVASAPDTSTVSLTWSAVTGATFYEVSRRTPAGAWDPIATPAVNSFSDTGRTAETTYVYRVRAGDAAFNYSDPSAADLATTMSTDSATIVAGTPIRAVDLTRLRTRVNAVRSAGGLSAYPFTDTVPVVVRAVHVNELRTALREGRGALAFTTGAFTDGTLVVGATTVKAVHFNELLDLMR